VLKPLLPEWRYWPAAALASLFLVALVALSLPPPLPPDDAKAPNQAPQRSQTYVDPRTAEERIADYTLWLERFTGLLVFVTGFQIAFLIRADSATRKSIDLARAEFLSTHRPRIILREAIIGSVLEGEPITVIITVANVGETKGKIVRSVITVEPVPAQIPRLLILASVEMHDDLGQIELPPGTSKAIRLPGATPKWEAEQYTHKRYMRDLRGGGSYESHKTDIHLAGQLIYVDEQGSIPRRTAFRRVLIPQRQRFYRVEGEPDLDYAD
jgi:hypothetical protein